MPISIRLRPRFPDVRTGPGRSGHGPGHGRLTATRTSLNGDRTNPFVPDGRDADGAEAKRATSAHPLRPVPLR